MDSFLITVILIAATTILFSIVGGMAKKKGPKFIDPEDTVLAIYSVEAKGTEASLAEALTPHLVLVINKYREQIQIVQNEAVEKALENVGLAASGACTDTECLPELGKILGANRFLVTSLTKLGKKYTVYATAYDAESGVAMFSYFEECACPDEELPEAVDRLAQKVMARLNKKKLKETKQPPLQNIKKKTPNKPKPLQPPKLNKPKSPDSPEIKRSELPPYSSSKKPSTEGMVLVPAGEFWMGCDKSKDKKDCHGQEEKQKKYLQDFYIDKYEVTVSKYSKCVKSGKCNPAHFDDSTCKLLNGENKVVPKQFRGGDHPVVCINWKEAQTYCEWEGKRLPTDDEWEKAARGADGRKYPWGNRNPSCTYAVYANAGNKKRGCGHNKTWPVGSKKKGVSPYGAYDMAGNVWEFTSHIYDEVWVSVRGGSWHMWKHALPAYGKPMRATKNEISVWTGFRCAMTN